MSQELDKILKSMSTATSACYDLNGDGRLINEEQTVFYQYADSMLLLLNEIHGEYDEISAGLANDPAASAELNEVWSAAITTLEDLCRTTTSPKLRAAVAKTAFAIDRTSTIIRNIPH